MGQFVPNVDSEPFEWGDPQWTGTDSDLTKDVVVARLDNSVQVAEDMLIRLVGADGQSGYLGELSQAVTSIPVPTITPITVTPPTLDLTPDSRPEIDMGLVDTDFPVFSKVSPVLTPLPSIDLSSLNPADLPDEITAAITWLEESHDVALFTDILVRLQSDLQSGSTGLAPEVEQAIYDRTIARQNIEDARVQAEIEDYFAARGFDLPPGAMAGRLAEQANEISRNRTDLNAKIFEEQARLAQSNSQFIIGAAKDLEAVLRDFTSKKNDRSLDYAKAVAANAISLYSEKIRAYIAAAEANKMYVEVQVENLKASVEHNKGMITLFAAEAEAYGTVVEGIAKKNQAVTDIYKAEVEGYKAETEALTAGQRNLIEKYRAELEATDIAIRAAIANASNAIQAYTAEGSLRERVSADMANIAMQSVASAYGMVNMNVGLSHSTGRSQGETFNHSESRSVSHSLAQDLNESHSFQEEAG